MDGDVEDCKAELISYERNHPDEFNKSLLLNIREEEVVIFREGCGDDE